MGGQNREGMLQSTAFLDPPMSTTYGTDQWRLAGGKIKPLKAAKKEKKELDEDDKAFLDKKRAGT
jgi:hypothetical protein